MSKIPAADNAVGEVENEYKYDTSKIPNHVIKDLACFFMSDIIAFYESAEGKEEYEKWKETNK